MANDEIQHRLEEAFAASGLTQAALSRASGIDRSSISLYLSGRYKPKADKLLCFKIADGLENRTIVSGIAKYYKPEDLVGKQVCFIANLPPRKLKGIESQGMILSAMDYDGSLSVATVERPVKPGSEVC